MWAWAEIEVQIFTIYVAAVGGVTGDVQSLQRAFFQDRVFRHRLRETHVWARPLCRVLLAERLTDDRPRNPLTAGQP